MEAEKLQSVSIRGRKTHTVGEYNQDIDVYEGQFVPHIVFVVFGSCIDCASTSLFVCVRAAVSLGDRFVPILDVQ